MRVIREYILAIHGPDAPEEESYDRETHDILAGRALSDAEDAINDQLPEGYQAKIREANAHVLR